MARIDHIIARRQEAARKPRFVWRQGVRVRTKPQHKQGSPWWRERFADLVERRRSKEAA